MYRKSHTGVHQDKSHMTKVYATSIHYLGFTYKATYKGDFSINKRKCFYKKL